VARVQLHRRLYLRIWLAVAVALMVLSVTLGWLWRREIEQVRAQRPGREIVVRNEAGDVVGQAPSRPVRVPGQGLEFNVTLNDGQNLRIQLPKPVRPPTPVGAYGRWDWSSESLWGFGTLLLVVALAVALGAYPVVRRLTKRLEALQKGVERWGDGDLSTRLPVQGNDEVAFLAERFNNAAQRVQSLLLSNKALLANASHELRSPLTRIRMGLELLQPPQGGADRAAREEIIRNVAELDELVDEILLASRLDRADAFGTPEEVDVLGLAAEECARTGAVLDLPDDGTPHYVVQGQPKLLRRLIRNLLENARRYGLRDGDPASVSLSLRLVPTGAGGGAELQLAVSDQGPGVPPEQRERIFEPFYRLPGASESEGGVGLGLALVRSIARRHGGRALCEAAPGGGARFVTFLPLR